MDRKYKNQKFKNKAKSQHMYTSTLLPSLTSLTHQHSLAWTADTYPRLLSQKGALSNRQIASFACLQTLRIPPFSPREHPCSASLHWFSCCAVLASCVVALSIAARQRRTEGTERQGDGET